MRIVEITEITDRPEKYEKINKKLDKFGISSQEKKSSLLYKILLLDLTILTLV